MGVLAAAAVAIALFPAASASAASPLRTGVVDSTPFSVPAWMPAAFGDVRAAGGTVIRFYANWSSVAPDTRPADPGSPVDPAYDWSTLDQQVSTAKGLGLEPILSIESAPPYAEGQGEGLAGTVRPSPTEYALFARAAARRYSGSFQGLPRVRYWQAWNEPNYFRHLGPQYNTPLSQPVRPSSRLLSPAIYRGLVNAFADSVHRVHSDNLVIAGGLTPFGNENADTHVARTMPFMRALLCMNSRDRPERGCRARIKFDVWSHHPYTSGGPRHHNIADEDISLGDLPEMGRLLRAAIRAGHVVSRRHIQWWATEFSWDTDPPDPNALPMWLHKRWVAEALYRMWRSGISLVTWFGIRDSASARPGEGVFQCGLYFGCQGGPECWRPKPSLTAFRFPFVAFKGRAGVRIWGRTPWGRRGRVVIEHRDGGWQRVATLRSDRYGIFTRTLRAPRRGYLRARLLPASGQPGELSVPFSLKDVPDRSVDPFG